MITFGANQSNVADRVARQLSRIGGVEVRKARTAVVVGYRSRGGSVAIAQARAQAVRDQLLRINPNLRVTVRVGGLNIAPQCATARNQCALVQLGN